MSEIIKLKDSNGIVKTLIEVAPRSKFKKKSKRKLKRFFVTSKQKDEIPNIEPATQVIETIHVYRKPNENQPIEKFLPILLDEKHVDVVGFPESLRPIHYLNEIALIKAFNTKISHPEIPNTEPATRIIETIHVYRSPNEIKKRRG